jgi:Sel1 repeat
MRVSPRIPFISAAFLFCTLISFAEIPSGIPQKASQATPYALHWSIDRILVRIEVKVEGDSSGRVWRNNTAYRFAFYSPSKQEAIWSDEEGNMDASGFPIPSDWSTEWIPSNFDDLPQALEKSHLKAPDFTKATLYYDRGKPQWLLELPNGDALQLHPSESIQTVLNEQSMTICDSQYQKKNFTNAFECYKNLAEQGLDVAQFNVAIMYIHGEGVAKSTDEAQKWLKKAADQGYPAAQDLLMKLQLLDFIKAAKVAQDFQKEGQSYFNQAEESYKKEDYANAFKLYTEASDHGVVEADYKLGLLYYNGQGTSKNAAKGMEMIRRAAKFGSPEAKKFLETDK